MTGTEISVLRPRKTPQERAARKNLADLPWLSAVRLPWGLEVRLLNISATGMLVETSSKFTPGTVAEFELRGASDAVTVPARFVRSEIVAVDGLGVRYRAAAVFEREVDLDGPSAWREPAESRPDSLASWLLEVSTILSRSVDERELRERLEFGLQRLVGAQTVRIVDEPVAAPAGGESIAIAMASDAAHPAVLQVTFDPGAEPSELDIRMLQAGAALASVVLLVSDTRRLDVAAG